MLLSSFFARSMAFTHTPKVQLPFALFSETFLTIRQNSLYVTVCIIARPSYRGYFIHSLSTLHYCNAPSLATRLTGDYRDRTYTGKCGPASLDTPHSKGDSLRCLLQYLFGFLFLTSYKDNTCTSKNYYNNSNYNWNQLINISSFWCGSIYRW